MTGTTKAVAKALLISGAFSAAATSLLFLAALSTNAWSNVARLCFLTFTFLASGSILSKAPSFSDSKPWKLPSALLPALVLVAFICAVIIRLREVQRTILDLLVLVIMWSLVFLQCVSAPVTRSTRRTILVESILVALFSMFSVNMIYTGYNGYRD